jgi:hypothetical protein
VTTGTQLACNALKGYRPRLRVLKRPQELWFTVPMVYERMSGDAPEDRVARVTVVLHNGESFSPNVVSIERELPSLWFEASDDHGRTRVIAVQEGAIAKVDISLAPGLLEREAVGFRISETSPGDDTPSTA